MSHKYLNLAAAFSAGVLAHGVAQAADAAFQNHLQSTPMVSPAQLYQTKELKTDFALGYDAGTDTTTPKGASKIESTNQTTGLFAGAVYNLKNLGLTSGLTVDIANGSTEADATTATGAKVKNTTDYSEVTVSPQAAYAVGPVVVGAALDVVQRASKNEGQEEFSRTFNRFRPGALFRADAFEAGLTYWSPNNDPNPTEEKTLGVVEPAQVTAHGRYAMNQTLALGAIVTNKNWKGINEDSYEDQQSVMGTVEATQGALKLEGDLGYATAYYKNDEAMSQSTIGTYTLGAAGDYAVAPTAAVGGALGYEFGSDETSGTSSAEYAKDLLTVSLRGKMLF